MTTMDACMATAMTATMATAMTATVTATVTATMTATTLAISLTGQQSHQPTHTQDDDALHCRTPVFCTTFGLRFAFYTGERTLPEKPGRQYVIFFTIFQVREVGVPNRRWNCAGA